MVISIHALREESDLLKKNVTVDLDDFNPRSPRGERPEREYFYIAFQNISIHALREESDATKSKSKVVIMISIHALREESD